VSKVWSEYKKLKPFLFSEVDKQGNAYDGEYYPSTGYVYPHFSSGIYYKSINTIPWWVSTAAILTKLLAPAPNDRLHGIRHHLSAVNN